MKRLLVLAAVAAIAAVAFALVTLPPRSVALAPASDGTLRGVLHIHTSRSDGRGTPEEVAAVAARAGVAFVVFTDHGDGTRAPDAPVYRSGVLCLDGVEISTAGGHYIALDMPASPYPLAGEPRDVVEDVRRLGGFGIAAHPDSPKPELQWSDWNAPIDAVEWINPDTSWRVRATSGWRARFSLIQGLLQYPIRPSETLASLLTGSNVTMARWNSLADRRRVVGVAGADAHAKLELRDADPGDNRFSIPLPGYQASFEMLSVRLRPDAPLSGDAVTDAALVMRAIRAGHLYTAIDGLASPSSFDFTAMNARGTARAGDELEVGGPVTLRIRSNAPPGFTTIVWRDGEVLTSMTSDGQREMTLMTEAEPAVYRVEIRTGEQTWLLSNAIYVRAPDSSAASETRTVTSARSPADSTGPLATALALFDGATEAGWHLETDPSSLAAMEVGKGETGSELRVRYGLADDSTGNQWAALVWGTPIGQPPVNVARYGRLTFTARADRPMRISVQLRADADGTLKRWQRSVYVDTVDRSHTVDFAELVPSEGTDIAEPPLEQVSQILFVVDTTNTRPGSSGRLWIQSAALQN
jgi:hypothetical protein